MAVSASSEKLKSKIVDGGTTHFTGLTIPVWGSGFLPSIYRKSLQEDSF